MSTERDTARAVEAWLAEPEPPLDNHVIDSAIDRLSSTPQRRRWWPFRWFPLGVGATRSAGPAGPHRDERKGTMFTATRVAAGVAVVALTGSLALIAGPLQPTPVSPAAESPSAMAVPNEAQHFTGQMGFELQSDPPPQFGDWETLPDGSEIMRDAWFTTRWTSSDDRFAGRGEYIGESITYPTDDGPGVRVLRTQLSFANDGGSWASRPDTMGIWADGAVIPVWFDGAEGYEGLSALVFATAIEYPNGHAMLDFEGWIVPGDRHFEDALE